MTELIDLDRTAEDAPAASVPALPARVWLRAWMPHHPVATGVVVGVVLGVVAALVWLTALAVRPAPQAEPVAAATHLVSVVTENVEHQTSSIIRRGADGDFVSRGEILGSEPSIVERLAGISVTVSGPGASCQIVIDGEVADRASVGPEGGQATCLWVAPGR